MSQATLPEFYDHIMERIDKILDNQSLLKKKLDRIEKNLKDQSQTSAMIKEVTDDVPMHFKTIKNNISVVRDLVEKV